jgi:NAD(P)H-nitrite reductase large subunit
MTRQVVIIGNGIAGITAARHIRKLGDHEITVVSAETDHFFSRTALMYVYMGHMSFEDTKPYEDWFWDKNRIRLMRAYVELVDTAERRLELSGGKRLPYDVLIVASGSRSNKFGWPGQDLRGVQGFYSYPDLQLMEENTEDVRRAVIVGGGLIGVETAEMGARAKVDGIRVPGARVRDDHPADSRARRRPSPVHRDRTDLARRPRARPSGRDEARRGDRL